MAAAVGLPERFRTASHENYGGAGSLSFTALLNRGAVTPEFNFLHRGVIPAGSGIGHHFHNVVKEMFVILDGENSGAVDARPITTGNAVSGRTTLSGLTQFSTAPIVSSLQLPEYKRDRVGARKEP